MYHLCLLVTISISFSHSSGDLLADVYAVIDHRPLINQTPTLKTHIHHTATEIKSNRNCNILSFKFRNEEQQIILTCLLICFREVNFPFKLELKKFQHSATLFKWGIEPFPTFCYRKIISEGVVWCLLPAQSSFLSSNRDLKLNTVSYF